MPGDSESIAPPRSGWRALAALLAGVAIVSLVHWHLLFEDSGSETLRDAANQCAACVTAASTPTPPVAAAALPIIVFSVPGERRRSLPAAPGARISIPRAPPL